MRDDGSLYLLFLFKDTKTGVQKRFRCNACRSQIESVQALLEHCKGVKHGKAVEQFDPCSIESVAPGPTSSAQGISKRNRKSKSQSKRESLETKIVNEVTFEMESRFPKFSNFSPLPTFRKLFRSWDWSLFKSFDSLIRISDQCSNANCIIVMVLGVMPTSSLTI